MDYEDANGVVPVNNRNGAGANNVDGVVQGANNGNGRGQGVNNGIAGGQCVAGLNGQVAVNNGDEMLPFTRDEDFLELKDKDDTTEIVAYVDEVHAPAVVGAGKFDLFKFIINNGGTKRMVCLVWGKALIERFVGLIAIGKILHIEGAVTKCASQTFYREVNNLVPFELLIKEHTTIEQLGDHHPAAANDIQAADVQDVTFADVGKTKGLVRIQGNIKLKFAKCENKFTKEIYGFGAITDGVTKVPIHISNYTGIIIEKGVLVTVVGEVDSSGSGSVTIKCRDENSVIPVPGAPKMSAAQVALGVKTPKRGHE